MARPETLEQLEGVYRSMNRHLENPDSWTFDAGLLSDSVDERTCLCIFTMGPWKLMPYSWNRLLQWIQPLLSEGILYVPNGANGAKGNLHFTLHQCSRFGTEEKICYSAHFLAELLRKLSGLKILFRGLVVTPTGIALRGFPSTEHSLRALTSVRNELQGAFQNAGIPFDPPYINDICHSTLFRWTQKPSASAIAYIQSGLQQWNECLVAELTPYQWFFGYGSLRMLPQEITELCPYWTPLRIAHRGLTDGPSRKRENNLETIRERCRKGLHSEIDVWWEADQFWIGHDAPSAPVDLNDLVSPFLWIHAKHMESFFELQKRSNSEGLGLRIFYHTDEDYVLTTHGETIIFPGLPDVEGWLSMMPERSEYRPHCVGYICSDYDS